MRKSERLVLTVATLGLALLLIHFNLSDPFRFGPPIRSDGEGYHIWVIALKTLDFSMCSFANFLSVSQSIALKNQDTGICGLKYPPGVGLLQFPFTFWWASADVSVGYSRAQHLAVSWLGAVLVYLTAAAMFITLRLKQVQVYAALLTVAAVVFGAGVYHYGTFDASFSHIYSAFGTSLAILFSVWRSRSGWNYSHVVLFVILLLWLYTIRQTNGLAIVVICCYAAWISQAGDRWKIASSCVVAVALGVGLQIQINRSSSGNLTLSSYGSEGFDTWPPAIWDVMANSGGGLFVYYPIFLIVFLIGISRRLSAETVSFMAITLGYILVYGSWYAPLLGAGFGHRGFVDVAPFVALALGSSLRSGSRKAFAVVTLALGVCVFVSLQIMTSYWHRTYPFLGASYEQYVSHVFRLPFSYHVYPEPYSSDVLRAVRTSFEGFRSERDGLIVMVGLTNTGTVAIDGRSEFPSRLALSWRLVDASSSGSEGWDQRLPFPSELQPGASATLEIFLVNIGDDADALEVSFVQEGEFWAHDIGVTPLSVPLGSVR